MYGRDEMKRQRTEELDQPQGILELQAVLSHLTWVLGIELGSSVRAVLSFHFRAISSASSPLISFQNFSHRNFQYVFYLGYRSF